MTVIKAGQAGPILERLSTVDLADHLDEARTVVERAKRRAAGIIAQARGERESVLEEARRSGHQTGYQQGHREGTEAGHRAAHLESIERFNTEHAHIVDDLQRATVEIDRMKEDLQITAQQNLLDFAVRVARKLTFAIGKLHRESASANFTRALGLVASKTDLTIRVHPDDIDSMKTFAESVLTRADESAAMKLISDDCVAPGGCTVTTDRTSVDATLDTQIDQMVSLLLGGNDVEPVSNPAGAHDE